MEAKVLSILIKGELESVIEIFKEETGICAQNSLQSLVVRLWVRGILYDWDNVRRSEETPKPRC